MRGYLLKAGILFLLYRKFLKSSEIVYNEQGLKNGITKERKWIRHDVVYVVLWFVCGLHYLTLKKRNRDYGFIHIP